MKNPLLSIIVTTYNIEKYVTECLDSIIGQTIQNIEIIVVDDGSRDRTPDILKDIAKKDERIKLFLLPKNTIGGVSTPANIGINAASGDYIGFADGDDIYDKTAFEKLYLAAKKHNADIAICGYEDFDSESGRTWGASDLGVWGELPPDEFIVATPDVKRRLLALSPVPWRKMYSRDFLNSKNIRFPEVDYFYEDNPLHWNVVLSCKNVSFVREVLCFHRMNRAGQTMAQGDLRTLNIFKHFSLLEKACSDAITSGDFFCAQNNSLSPQLLRWAVGHWYWCSQMVGMDRISLVFDCARDIAKRYPLVEVAKAAHDGWINSTDQRLFYAAKVGDLRAFDRILSNKDTGIGFKLGLVVKYYGLGHVFRVSIARLKQATDRLTAWSRKRSNQGHPPADPGRDEILWRLRTLEELHDVSQKRRSLLELLHSFRNSNRSN